MTLLHLQDVSALLWELSWTGEFWHEDSRSQVSRSSDPQSVTAPAGDRWNCSGGCDLPAFGEKD